LLPLSQPAAASAAQATRAVRMIGVRMVAIPPAGSLTFLSPRSGARSSLDARKKEGRRFPGGLLRIETIRAA
jgi:hypothetical protein